MTEFHAHIKARTELAHQAAEEAPFIAHLMGGSLTRAAYLDYLRALAPIYRRMEELFRLNATSSPLSYLDHRALDRTALIEADIDYLEKTVPALDPEPALESVAKYLHQLHEKISPVRLSAHHYIRYLGDLSGGQAIARLVSRHYEIASEGLNFYNFEGIGDIVFYKKRYRDFLNLIPLAQSESDEFLDEVESLYSLTRDIFVELGELHQPQAKVIP
jgi:heme oxygenase